MTRSRSSLIDELRLDEKFESIFLGNCFIYYQTAFGIVVRIRIIWTHFEEFHIGFQVATDIVERNFRSDVFRLLQHFLKFHNDFDENILLIDSAITYVSNQPILKETKTKKVRLLPIPDRLIPWLKETLNSIDGNIIFSYKGGFMTKSAFRYFSNRIFKKINTALGGDKETNMLNGLTFYTFRHNKATALTEGGIDLSLKAQAEYMGHSVDMLLNTYSHVNIAKEDPRKFDLT